MDFFITKLIDWAVECNLYDEAPMLSLRRRAPSKVEKLVARLILALY